MLANPVSRNSVCEKRGTDPPPDSYRDRGELGEANALAGIH